MSDDAWMIVNQSALVVNRDLVKTTHGESMYSVVVVVIVTAYRW